MQATARIVMHQLYLDDLVTKNQWHVVGNDTSAILCSEGGRAFWRIARAAFDPKFRGVLEDILAKREQPCDMLAR